VAADQLQSICFKSRSYHRSAGFVPAAVGQRSNKCCPAGGAAVEIFSDQFEYATNSGVAFYRGNVRLTGTNLALVGGMLTVVLPMSGPLKPAGMQKLTVETNVW